MGRGTATKNEAKAAVIDSAHAVEHAVKTPVKAVTGDKHHGTRRVWSNDESCSFNFFLNSFYVVKRDNKQQTFIFNNSFEN